MEVNEFEIPVPWGHIAAKSWGNEKNQLILMLHGTSDNAGSFDRLIAYLPKTFFYVCIDLPSNGKSSHFPENLPLHEINFVIAVKIVIDWLTRDKIIIIGHSWGGQMAMFYTQIFSERVIKLIMIEAVYFPPVSPEYFRQFTTEYIENTIIILKKAATKKLPTYTYKKAENAFIYGRIYGQLNDEAAPPLLERCLKRIGEDKFHISNDIRLKARHGLFLDMNLINALIKEHPVMCPILFIAAKDSLPLFEYFKQFLVELKKINKSCVTREVEGNHDVHNNNPENVAPLINSFLADSKL